MSIDYDRLEKLLALANDERTPSEERRNAAVKACQVFAPMVPHIRKLIAWYDKHGERFERILERAGR